MKSRKFHTLPNPAVQMEALQSSEGEGLNEEEGPLSCDLSNEGSIFGDRIEP